MALTIQFFQTGAAAIPALTVIATQRPNMKYSHELARDVKGRELAAEGVMRYCCGWYEFQSLINVEL